MSEDPRVETQGDVTVLQTRLTALLERFLAHVASYDTKELESLEDHELAALFLEYVDTHVMGT